MTTPSALPSLPGLAWSRHKKPGFSTRVASHVSGREVRVALMSYPLYEFEAVYNGLTSSATATFASLGSSSLQSLMGFFLQLLGQVGIFLYTDPDDNSVTGQGIGAGDGTTLSFVMGRTLGGFNEPVGWVTNVVNVYLNGVRQSASSWAFTAPNSLGFYTAPGAGVAITADFTYAFQCRFLDDRMDFEEFMSSLWKLDSMKFRSIKASTIPAVAPLWYNLYSIDGAMPTLFADFTTEGTTDHYYYNGSTYAGEAAYATAIGLTETRASSAEYTSSSGLLASASSGALRIGDYNPLTSASNGILFEGASTNLVEYSQDYTQTYWAGYSNAVTVTGASETAPDGTNTANLITATSTANVEVVGAPTLSASTYAMSAYVKAGTNNYAALALVGTNAGNNYALAVFTLAGSGSVSQTAQSGSGTSLVSSSIASVGNGWYRIQITVTLGAVGSSPSAYALIELPPAGSGNSIGTYGRLGATSGHTIYAWGVQIEALPLASSYIPTTTSTASRAADSFKRTRTNPTSITKLIKSITPPGVPTAECTVWSADDGTDNNYIRVVYYSDGHIRVLVEASDTSQANLDMGAVAVNTTFTLAFTASANNFLASLNGGTAVTSSSGTMPTGLVNDRIGSGVDAGDEWFSDVMIDAEWTNLVATAAQLQALS